MRNNPDVKRAYDKRYKQEVAAKDRSCTLLIGPLKFVEHSDSIRNRFENPKNDPQYAFWGGEILTEFEIRRRVK